MGDPGPVGDGDAIDPGDWPRITIDRSEWEDVGRRVRPMLREDERDPLGFVGLVIGGGRRRWVGGDGTRLAVWDAAADDRELTLAVSPRLIDAVPFAAGDADEVDLVVDPDDDGPRIGVVGPGGSLFIDLVDHPVLDVDLLLAERREADGDGPVVVVGSERLRDLVEHGRRAPAGPFLDDDRPDPVMWLVGAEHLLGVRVSWGELGTAVYSLQVAGGAPVEVAVGPLHLSDLFEALDPGEAELRLPAGPPNALWVRQGAFTGLLMPDDVSGPVRARVDEVLTALFGPDVVHTDADGDHLLSTDGVPIWAKLLPAEPPRLQVFAHVLEGVEDDPELLAELNQLNASTGMAKLLWLDGVVMVVGTLVASTVDEVEVATLHEHVAEVAEGLGPALAARFGGEVAVPGKLLRWANYSRALIRAELSPGVWTPLNGPAAPPTLPFPGPVHVLTAHNPYGRVRSDEANEEATLLLVAELLAANAGFTRAVGGSAEGDVSERGFLVWGLHVDTVLEIARSVRQEAVFELTDDEVAVVGVNGERLVMPRTQEDGVD